MPNRSKYELPDESKKTKGFLLHCAPQLLEECREEAKREGENLSVWMRKVLRERLDWQKDRRARWAQNERGKK